MYILYVGWSDNKNSVFLHECGQYNNLRDALEGYEERIKMETDRWDEWNMQEGENLHIQLVEDQGGCQDIQLRYFKMSQEEYLKQTQQNKNIK